ncbi:FAD-dependent monooxygenase [Streptomyces sp. URMC 123]|uniref:FAD-dependent monooxygenase n=1 Tax=Streptomyces sp. URMC 123 TaxID=3423403 RepID=UPI003F19B3EA
MYTVQKGSDMTTVLITGAGIAGSALAHRLLHHGLTPTVVERAPAPRSGGQAVDIRGVALDVVERMGLLEQARAVRTRMRGMSILDPEGNEIERSTEATLSSGRLDSDDIEILRQDLVELLHEHTRDGVEYVFGDSVTALHQGGERGREQGEDEDGDGILVDFAHGPSRRFDVVVGADGLHSTVRRLAFGPEERFSHHLGSYLSVFSADNFLGLDNWQLWQRDGDIGFGIMPVRDNTELRIAFGFHSGRLDGDHRDTEWLRALIAERISELRWEAERLEKAVRAAPDFYCDAMSQIRMDRWSRGRVALLGDAGYCASPLSGQGTSLALVGAYALAAELARAGGDHRAAFARYEQRMRPYVGLNQALATENPGAPASEESMARAKNAFALDA